MSLEFISAFSAIAGSVIGALSGVTTTWLTLSAQERGRRLSEAMSRREALYGEFMDEAAKLLTDAIGHKLDDPSKFVHIYALIGKLRLFSPAQVILAAEDVMTKIIEAYAAPIVDFNAVAGNQQRMRDLDILRMFGEACRREMILLPRLPQPSYRGASLDELAYE